MSLITRMGLIFGLAVITIGLGWVFYEKFGEISSYRADVAQLIAEQEEVQAEIEALSDRLELREDYSYIEYLARKELGLIYPGEEKYIIVGEIE